MEKDTAAQAPNDHDLSTLNVPHHDPAKPETPDDSPGYATGLRLFLIMLTILTSTSLAAIEIGIVATAIPGITDDFHRLDDVGWYGNVTLILAGAGAPIWGKVYKYLNVKWSYLASVAFYLLGSVVAGAAPNSVSVIVGRALQGKTCLEVLG
jgi:MFS family permease